MLHDCLKLTACAALATAMVAAPTPAAAGDAATFREALVDGTPSLSLRYRFESVDDDAFTENGYASTLRAALGYATRSWHGFSARVEVQSVLDLGYENRHDDRGGGRHWNGVTDRPVIADPSLTGFYQAYVQWRAASGTTVKVGRQAILLDNVRFVGNVGWRQFHQSFDALRLDATLGADTRLTYAYVWKQNRIFGDSRAMGTHLLNLGGKLGGATLTGYAYLVDYDAPGPSTLTLGARLAGSLPAGEISLPYDLEAAKQSDAGDNPREVDAWYYRIGGGVAVSGFTVRLAYEVLEATGHGGAAFSTPLATLHAWNGWADMFLRTPDAGLEDLALTLGYRAGGWKLLATYHDFAPERGGKDYGTEFDLLFAYTTSWKQTFALKAAAYDAEAYGRDVTKIWAFTAWAF